MTSSSLPKLYKEEYIRDIKGICTHTSCTQNPFVTSTNTSSHSQHPDSIFSTKDFLSDDTPSLLNKLYKNNPSLTNIFSFINKTNYNPNFEELAEHAIAKKDIQLNELFDDLINHFTKELLEMKSNIRAFCLEKQINLVKSYFDSLNNIFNNNYDVSALEQIIQHGICHKSNQDLIKNYLTRYNSPQRSRIDRLLIGLYELVDAPLSFGEVPEIIKSTRFPTEILNLGPEKINHIKSEISSFMNFNTFSPLINTSKIFPVKFDTFCLNENSLNRVITNDNGWLSSLVSFPPASLMHHIGDTRLPLIYPKDNKSNALAVANTEGDVSIWNFNGKLREIFREGKLISSLVVFPPLKLLNEATSEEEYTGIIAGFSADHITLWDITNLRRKTTTRLAHEHFLSAALAYPYRTETQHPYYPSLGKIVQYNYCLVTTGADLTLKVWSIPDLKPMKTIMNVNPNMLGGLAIVAFDKKEMVKTEGKGPKRTRSVQITKEGRNFYLVTYDKEIKVWELEKNRVIAYYKHNKTITSFVVIDSATQEDPYGDTMSQIEARSSKFRTYFIFSSDDTINIMIFPQRKMIKRITKAHTGTIRKLELVHLKSQNGEPRLYLMSTGVDKMLKIWDWKKGTCIREYSIGVKCDGNTMLCHETIEGNLRKQQVVVAGRTSFGKKVLHFYNN